MLLLLSISFADIVKGLGSNVASQEGMKLVLDLSPFSLFQKQAFLLVLLPLQLPPLVWMLIGFTTGPLMIASLPIVTMLSKRRV